MCVCVCVCVYTCPIRPTDPHPPRNPSRSGEGLRQLVAYNKKVVFDVKLKEMHTQLSDMISENAAVPDVIEVVKARHKKAGLADSVEPGGEGRVGVGGWLIPWSWLGTKEGVG